MRKIFTKTAFTLIELIVALMLMALMVLGIFSISSVLNNNNQDYGQRYLVRSETQATLNHILKNASLAIGTGTTITPGGGVSPFPDLGILSTPQMNLAHFTDTICIHQDVKSGLLPDDDSPNNTPSDYSDDRWLCYSKYNASRTFATGGGTELPYQLWYCSLPYVIGSAWGGATDCSNVAVTSPPVYLGTAYSITNPFIGGVASSPTFNNGLFSITIQNCLNNSKPSDIPPGPGTCNGGGDGISSDPANNPEVQVTGSVSPAQQSI